MKNYFIFTFLIFFLNAYEPTQIQQDFSSKGYHEIQNTQFGSDFYDQLYTLFDMLSLELDRNESFKESLEQISSNFLESKKAQNEHFPIGFYNRGNSSKNKKVFFHFSEKYYISILESQTEILHEFPLLAKFLKLFHELNSYLQNEFQSIISATNQISSINDLNLDILIKLVRYEPSQQISSIPHYDFSLFTLLLDNTDKNEESLIFSHHKEKLQSEDFRSPIRIYKRECKTSSMLLIPGLMLNEAFSKPTPHAVKKSTTTRHALIGFLINPNQKITQELVRIPVWIP